YFGECARIAGVETRVVAMRPWCDGRKFVRTLTQALCRAVPLRPLYVQHVPVPTRTFRGRLSQLQPQRECCSGHMAVTGRRHGDTVGFTPNAVLEGAYVRFHVALYGAHRRRRS